MRCRRAVPVLVPALVTVVVAALGTSAGPASAYRYVSTRQARWEKPVVTYSVGGPLTVPVARGARAWNRLGLRVRLARVGSPSRADIRIRSRGRPCAGAVGQTNVREVRFSDGVRSFALISGPFDLRIAAGCGPTTTFIVAHELGHALGLGHELRRCALMNPEGDADLARPQCPRRPAAYWLAHLIRPDDARGIRALYARPLRPELYSSLPAVPPGAGGAARAAAALTSRTRPSATRG